MRVIPSPPLLISPQDAGMYITPITVLSSQCANVNVAATFSSMLLPIHADFDIFSVLYFLHFTPFPGAYIQRRNKRDSKT